MYGGGSGNDGIGAYVAKLDPITLDPLWHTQLTDTAKSGEWNYPGAQAILDDGNLYVIYGHRLAKVNPASGRVIARLALPTGGASPSDTAFNGFNATSDGTIVAKAFYRQAGCDIQGPHALTKCPDPSDVPDSVLVTIDPDTMKVIDEEKLPTMVIGRTTVGRHNGEDFVYFFAGDTCIRYRVRRGSLSRDSSWKPGPLLARGQTAGWALVVLNDWVVGQTNGLPASAAMSVFAVHQSDASKQFKLRPFAGDPVPPLVKAAFSKQAPDGNQAVSWNAATVSVDPGKNRIYVMDALPGKVAALRLTSAGLKTDWEADQTTTEFLALIGPSKRRVIVGSDIPRGEIPGRNRHDAVVWRDAGNGRQIARSQRLPAITSGTMVQPGYSGDMFYPGLKGAFYKLRPAPTGRR